MKILLKGVVPLVLSQLWDPVVVDLQMIPASVPVIVTDLELDLMAVRTLLEEVGINL